MEWIKLLAGFPSFDIQVTDTFIVHSVSVTTNLILKKIHRNLVAAPGYQSPQLLAPGDASATACSPTPVAVTQTSLHMYTYTLSCTLWIIPVNWTWTCSLPNSQPFMPWFSVASYTHTHTCAHESLG